LIAGGDLTVTIVPLKALIERKSLSVLTPDAARRSSDVVRDEACLKKGLSFRLSKTASACGQLHCWSLGRALRRTETHALEFPWEPPR
jgi:hypothetical protein